jgi:hypothetical protein
VVQYDHLILVRKKFPSPHATWMDEGRICGVSRQPAKEGSWTLARTGVVETTRRAPMRRRIRRTFLIVPRS